MDGNGQTIFTEIMLRQESLISYDYIYRSYLKYI